MTLEPKRSALFGTVPLVTLVDSCLEFGGWFRLVPHKAESTLVVGSVATLTQQADLRFDKEAMLKMIRESREHSQEWFVIPCTQTAHRRFLYFYESVSLSAAYTWLFRPFVRLSIYRSVWIPLLLNYIHASQQWPQPEAGGNACDWWEAPFAKNRNCTRRLLHKVSWPRRPRVDWSRAEGFSHSINM